jgi:hypothetical protein
MPHVDPPFCPSCPALLLPSPCSVSAKLASAEEAPAKELSSAQPLSKSLHTHTQGLICSIQQRIEGITGFNRHLNGLNLQYHHSKHQNVAVHAVSVLADIECFDTHRHSMAPFELISN